MKNLRNYYAAFLLFALLFVSAAAPAQTDCSKTGSDFRHYGNPSVGVHPVLREVCNLFHPAVGPPSSRKGQFPPACDCLPRRLRPSHGDCNRRLWSRLCPQSQVSRGTFRAARCQHDFVEYRYFLESTPEPKDWQYLTAENSADDLHAVRNAFKSIYPGKWIATGISKGGQTTLLYRTFYPDDVDISVPYVAPLCYGVEDGRHEPFLRKVSTPEDRKRIEDFQLEVLKRKAALLPRFEKYCDEKGLKFRAPVEEIYDYCVLEYSFALWQWGTPVSSIPATTASDDEIFAHLLDISNPDYFIADSPTASFFVQAAHELGYYGYDTKPFKKYLSIQSSKDYLHRLMLPEELKDMPFDKTLSKKITKFLKENDPKMIFIYGQNDPWTAAGVTWLKGKKNIHVFVEPGGSHRARIGTLPDVQKQEAISLINKWLQE